MNAVAKEWPSTADGEVRVGVFLLSRALAVRRLECGGGANEGWVKDGRWN